MKNYVTWDGYKVKHNGEMNKSDFELAGASNFGYLCSKNGAKGKRVIIYYIPNVGYKYFPMV